MVSNETSSTSSYLRILDGIRCLTSGWIVFGHCIFIPFLYNGKNVLEISVLQSQWYDPFFIAAYYAVDVFSFLMDSYFIIQFNQCEINQY